MKKRYIFAVISFALVTIAGIWCWDPLPPNPSSAQLSEMAQSYDVEIIRDNWGVPHIYGKTNPDTAFGLGYAHGEDDFETIQLTIAATRGVLARRQGKGAAVSDYIVSFLGVWQTIKTDYQSRIPQDIKDISKAYADGLNLYAAHNPDELWQGLAPFTPEDIVAGFMYKTPFFYGLDVTLLDLLAEDSAPDTAREIALDDNGTRKSWHVSLKSPSRRGSNGFAVNKARSDDNTTRLVINSHQPLTGPVAWYEAHLVSEAGWNMSGSLFPATPVILQGFNDHLGWANTVSAQDLVDVFALERNPDNRMQYKLDGDWVDFEQISVVIRVKLFGPFALKAKRKILRSAHGPVIETKHKSYAVRYAGMGEIRQLEQYYRLNHAQNLAEFQAAMQINALPSINYIYADKDDNIAFIHNAQYPARKDGQDWHRVMPGDRSDVIWQGYRPYGDIPKLINPVSGFIYNANNTPYSATDGPDNLKPENFPSSMGLQDNQTNRSLRIMELTDGTSPIGRQALLDLKFDNAYAQNSQARQFVSQILAIDWSGQPQLQDAVGHLRAWDFKTDKANRHAALGVLSVLKHVLEDFTHEPAPPPATSFRWAVNYLTQHYGRIDPQWGELNRLVRGDVDIPIDGGPDVLRAIYPTQVGEDGRLQAGAGDSWIALVEWGPSGVMNASVIHQFGSATLDETSPHYSDQVQKFADHEWRKALRDKDEIRANATRIYRPNAIPKNF